MQYHRVISNIGLILSSLLVSSPVWALPTEISGFNLSQRSKVQVSLKEAKLATVVVFLSAKCPCSASHQPVLNEMAKEFEKAGIRFVGVHSNANEDSKLSEEYFKNAALSFPVVRDEKAKLADQFEAFKTPHVFVVSPKLEILYQGGVDNSKLVEKASRHYLKEALLAIRDGKSPPEKNVRVLGCEIKRP